jgi:PPK2 family polyphosphate:nucleotide phosphotransferase
MNKARTVGDLASEYAVVRGKDFDIDEWDPADTGGLKSESKGLAAELLQEGIRELAKLQDMLYAQDRWALLLIFQAMDAAGKDSTIKHVMSGVNPQGVQVYSFKAPSPEELDHDFLWRTMRCTPERGRIGIFNRSYYEEVLVVRVHKNLLKLQHLPEELVTKKIWDERFEDINAYERYLTRNGILVRKFFLNVSKEEQKKRFLARLDEPEKNWKFSPADVHERECWDEYQNAYEKVIRNTATKYAPWYVVPADNKWFARLVVVAAIVDALKGLKMSYPELDAVKRQELADSRAALEAEKS